MKLKIQRKSLRAYFCIIGLLCSTMSCSDDGAAQRAFPSEHDISGHWQLARVYANDGEISFNEYIHQMQNEFYRLSGDHSAHRVVAYETLAGGSNYTWSLSNDTLTVDGSGVFQVKSASWDELVLVPKTLFGLRLVYKPIDENEFPVMVFDATVDGETFKTCNAGASELDTNLQLSGSGGSFWLAIHIPATAKATDTYDLSVGHPGVGVLLLRDNHEYGYTKSGQITIVKKNDRYVYITFDVVVADGNDNQVVISEGAFGSLIFPR